MIIDEPSLAIRTKFFEDSIKPHLKYEPKGDDLSYWVSKGWEKWYLDVSNKEWERVMMIKQLCEELAKVDPNQLVALISVIGSEVDRDYVRTAPGGHAINKAFDSQDKESTVKAQLDQYKDLFESSFRLWSSVPYYYLKQLSNSKKVQLPEKVIGIGASDKLATIESSKVNVGRNNVAELAIGVNRMIRNAGGGHDRWEVTDEGTVILKDLGKAPLELTISDLNRHIKDLRKAIWIIEVGVALFLNHNPKIEIKLQRTQLFRIAEVRRSIERILIERWMKVVNLNVSDDKKNVSITLQYSPKVMGRKSQIYFGTAAAYDVIHVDFWGIYREQAFGAMAQIANSWKHNKWPMPNISVELLDDKGMCLGHPSYSSADVATLLQEGKTSQIRPQSGTMPDKKYVMTGEIRVPYGEGEKMARLWSVRNVLRQRLLILGAFSEDSNLRF
ncbi:hypothetical protein DRH29_01690 [candidate division Kazan bacterium]|uniref:Uncharacterized protein n=1 Tax=candidate division Kazan bacterium TaxID=2202143 RepID=A0A420ZDB2_UNCK3|nr:MAG: hypothetical protein DRH29_01690 [candidate division Kazan bacterium]